MKTTLFLKATFFITCIILSSCIKRNHAPVINDQQFSIAENSPAGTLAGQVLAIDEEDDQTLTYSILSGNKDNAFEISATDGMLKINNEEAIDFETSPVFNLVIEVRDSKNKSASSEITVSLTNVDPPTGGLILYYPFDGNMNDLSNAKNNGINYTAGKYVAGKWGQALDFNGTSDYFQLSDPINSSYGLSFSFWINTRGVNGLENNGVIISKYNMTAQMRCFMVYSFGSGTARTDNRLSAAFYKFSTSASYHDQTKSYFETAELAVYPTPASFWTLTNPKRLEPGVWTHCVVNVTSTSIEVWLNGELCTKKQREYTSYFDTPDEPVYIGNNLASGEGTNNHFNGILDEFRIYYRELSVEEIQTLFKEK